MLSIKRGIFLLILSLVGLGISRGWVHVCVPCNNTERDKISMGIAVDSQKIGADFDNFKRDLNQRASERRAEGLRE